MASVLHAPDARGTDDQPPAPALVPEKREDTVPTQPVPGPATPSRRRASPESWSPTRGPDLVVQPGLARRPGCWASLASPHLTYRHTLKETASARKEARTASHRGAANDLRRHGLAVDGGRTRGGEEVRLLTAAGLAAAAIDLDREPEEMGGMPKSGGRSGALHPMTVNEMVIALIRPVPDLDLVAGSRPKRSPPRRLPSTHPRGSAPSPPAPPRSRSR